MWNVVRVGLRDRLYQLQSGSGLTPDIQQWNICSHFSACNEDHVITEVLKIGEMEETFIHTCCFLYLERKSRVRNGTKSFCSKSCSLLVTCNPNWLKVPLFVMSRVKKSTNGNGYYGGFEAVILTGSNNWVTCFSQLLVIHYIRARDHNKKANYSKLRHL